MFLCISGLPQNQTAGVIFISVQPMPVGFEMQLINKKENDDALPHPSLDVQNSVPVKDGIWKARWQVTAPAGNMRSAPAPQAWAAGPHPGKPEAGSLPGWGAEGWPLGKHVHICCVFCSVRTQRTDPCVEARCLPDASSSRA